MRQEVKLTLDSDVPCCLLPWNAASESSIFQFSDAAIVNRLKRQSNLRDMLVRSEFPSIVMKPSTFTLPPGN